MKNIFTIFLICSGAFSLKAQTIATSALSSAAFCQNEDLNVDFTITGVFNPANVFIAELSDATGGFGSPVTIGTLIGTTAGTINATIPNLMTTGTQYRIRVVGSDPAIIGTDNGTDLTITGSATDPSIFGSNEWNVYAYSIASYTNNVNAFNYSDYRGMYTEPNQSFQSSDQYGIGSTPSNAPGYIGCNIGNDRHIVQYKREGFTCGKYQINVAGPNGETGFDDAAKLIIDGVTVWSNSGCCIAVNNVWTGILGPTSQIEFVWSDNAGNSYGRLTFEEIDLPTISPDVTICAGTSTTLTASGATNYDWSTNSTHLVAPLNTASVVCSPPGATPNSIETYTVSTTDAGTGCILSSSIDVTIDPTANTSITPTTDTYCGTGSTDVIASGANTYTYFPMTNVTINSASGHLATLAPTTTTTYTVTGSNNCATSDATVTINVNIPAGDPNDYGLNTWNVYAYSGNNFNTYMGMYVHNTLDFDTRTLWGSNSTPSNAAGYTGCPIGVDQHSFRYKREGFPCGFYILDIPNHDDIVNLIIDGVSVFTQNTWFGNVYKADIWSGYLDENSTIEYTVREFGGGSSGGLAFNYEFGPNNSANETVWNGNVSTDWFDSDNWCNNVPSATITALIPTGRTNYPDINAIGAITKNINIQTGSSVTISGVNELEVHGSWLNDGTFNPNNSSVTFMGGAQDSIYGTGTHLFNHLTLNKGITANALKIKSNVTVNGNLTLTNGILNTESNNLIIGATGTALTTSNNSHVLGFVQKTGNSAFVFPTGDGTSYRPIAISAPSVITDHFTASYYHTSPDNALPTPYTTSSVEPSINHVSTCEYWILDRTNGTSDVSVTLSWGPTSCGVTSLSDLVVARWDGTKWADHSNGGTTGNNASGTVVSFNPVTNFSPFTLASIRANNPLPIELLSFNISANERTVELTWQTASEKNNDYFTIEKSKDGIEWIFVEKINGAGNSSSILNYNTTDNNPFSNVSYYRLKQTDFDGKFEYADVKTVEFLGNDNPNISIYPNPTENSITVEGNQNEIGNIKIFNILGQDVTEITIINSQNDSELIIDMSLLNEGIYFLKTKMATYKIYKK